MARYIHFEGMDLAGKSTASRLLAENPEEPWEIRNNSIDPDNPVFQLANSLRLSKGQMYSAETMGPLYVAASLADVERFRQPEVDTVQDSTIIVRSMAWHSINKTPGVVEALRPILPRFRVFDMSFVFTAAINVRQQRLEQRIATAPETVDEDDYAVLRKPERFLAMESTLIDIARTAFDAVVVDTTDMTPQDVQTTIAENIERL